MATPAQLVREVCVTAYAAPVVHKGTVRIRVRSNDCTIDIIGASGTLVTLARDVLKSAGLADARQGHGELSRQGIAAARGPKLTRDEAAKLGGLTSELVLDAFRAAKIDVVLGRMAVEAAAEKHGIDRKMLEAWLRKLELLPDQNAGNSAPAGKR